MKELMYVNVQFPFGLLYITSNVAMEVETQFAQDKHNIE